jgi:hypothetical protein
MKKSANFPHKLGTTSQADVPIVIQMVAMVYSVAFFGNPSPFQ